MTIKKKKKRIEKLGWSFEVEIFENNDCLFTLSNCGRFGKDFTTELTAERADPVNFLKALDYFIEGFDVDYETYLWLGPDGHGVNNAPYYIRDILEENEEYISQLEEISDSITAAIYA